MRYTAIGIMSGSSLDGLDICYTALQETGGKWEYEILHAACFEFSTEWVAKLREATTLTAYDYALLHSQFGKYIGEQVNLFIKKHQLEYKVGLIASHGHTTFHAPGLGFTGQIGCGAQIAAITGLPVVTDLRALDIAFGGQGAPIVPIGEHLLLGDYNYYLNIGGIANISYKNAQQHIAFDVCPANRILNSIVETLGLNYDDGGSLASSGKVSNEILKALNDKAYYQQAYPKSLANDFGIEEIYPILKNSSLSQADQLATMVAHIGAQLAHAITQIKNQERLTTTEGTLLVTGGGAYNTFLIKTIQEHLLPFGINIEVPNNTLINYKEALIIAFMGVLRWREAYNVLPTVTGASRASINGALWLGGED
jgi:anhydro-N-acetylmuramic acid kinase